jgi:SynChlorMet cassette protein ScmC
MELEECDIDGSARLVFCIRDNTHEALDRMLDVGTSKSYSSGRDDGWYSYYHRTLRVWCHNSIPDVVCEVLVNKGVKIELINMWFALQAIYQRSISKGGLPFHAGLIELGGRGVLLAAAGDTGKSTCCRRIPHPWRLLCDDEVLVALDKQQKYRAHPFPTWSDYLWQQSEKTWNVQFSVPLFGVFFLEQSEGDEVKSIGEGEAALLMTESAIQICHKFWRSVDKEDQKKFREELFNSACKMAKKIPAYRLGVSLNGRFWEKIEQVLGRMR